MKTTKNNIKENHIDGSWVDCTGNAVTGDYVNFQRAVFSGSFRNAKFSHYEEVEGLIINDSYGAKSGQHTFTILPMDGEKTRIKGRNLYRNGVKRLLWIDESERKEVLEDKYERRAGNRENVYAEMIM